MTTGPLTQLTSFEKEEEIEEDAKEEEEGEETTTPSRIYYTLSENVNSCLVSVNLLILAAEVCEVCTNH